MHIRFIHNYFYPDPSSVSQIVSDLAFYLAARGHQVSVIASQNVYTGGGRCTRPAKETVKGVSIRRVWAPSLGKGSLVLRLTDQLSFTIGAIVASLSAQRADTVVLLTNPPLFALLGLVLRRFRGERFVYVVMDLYPDLLDRAELLKTGSLLARLMSWVTSVTLKGANQVVVLGECMRQAVISRGADPNKTVIIHNWADEQALRSLDRSHLRFREVNGFENQFVVMYSGNMGVAHRFEDLLEAARRMRSRPDIRFVFIGGGVRRREIEQYVARHNLTNISIFPYQDRSALAETLGAADVHFISLREGFEGLVVPSKVYGIMAVGRPVLYQGNPNGEVARIIRENDCGEVLQEGDIDALELAILRLYHDRALIDLLGKRARAALDQEYSMQRGLDQYEAILARE